MLRKSTVAASAPSAPTVVVSAPPTASAANVLMSPASIQNLQPGHPMPLQHQQQQQLQQQQQPAAKQAATASVAAAKVAAAAPIAAQAPTSAPATVKPAMNPNTVAATTSMNPQQLHECMTYLHADSP
jgi:hypothetical protein